MSLLSDLWTIATKGPKGLQGSSQSVQPFQGSSPVVSQQTSPRSLSSFWHPPLVAPVTPPRTGGGGSTYGGSSGGSLFQQPQPQPEGNPTAMIEALKKSLSGDVPAYAGLNLSQPRPTSIQAGTTANELQGYRADIGSGTTDPYKMASMSGIPYTASELKAIESAAAGVYDPAINSALARLEDAKSREEMKQKFEYDMALKKTPSGDSTVGINSSSGGYEPGMNPVVDSWVERISRGEATLADIKGASKEVQGLRNAVNMGLNTLKYRNATAMGNLSTVNQLNDLLENTKLSKISGFFGQAFGGISGAAKTAKTDFDQVKSKLELTAAALLKGQGQVSNFERDILQKASSNLNRGLADDEFRQRLVQLKGVFQNTSGLPAMVKISFPDGRVLYNEATTDQINQAIMDGGRVEYIEDVDVR